MSTDSRIATSAAHDPALALPSPDALAPHVCVTRGGVAVAGLGVSVIRMAGLTPGHAAPNAASALAALIDAERLSRAGFARAADSLEAYARRSSMPIDEATLQVVEACVQDLPRQLVVIGVAGRPQATPAVTLLDMDLYRRPARAVEEVDDANAAAAAAAAHGLDEIADEIRSWAFIEGLRAATRADATSLELSVLAEHPDPEVRRAVALHAHTSEADQALLAHDPSPRVRDAAWLHACCLEGDPLKRRGR